MLTKVRKVSNSISKTNTQTTQYTFMFKGENIKNYSSTSSSVWRHSHSIQGSEKREKNRWNNSQHSVYILFLYIEEGLVFSATLM